MDPKDFTAEFKAESSDRQMPANYTGLIPVFLLLVVIIARISYELYKSKRQKTRNPQERRMYAGARARPASFPTQEPTIYVSPVHNLPPPPKYEFMAPPSYEEVVGIHYPQLQQPITQPITAAMRTENETTNEPNATSSTTISSSTVVTVNAEDRRTSVTVATTA